MAKPKNLGGFDVGSVPAGAGSKYSYAKLRALWIEAGGNPSLASTMAAIALAESGGSITAHNSNAKTGDDSYGLWQINYYGPLAKSRTAQFGPTSKITDPLTNARAAVALAGTDGSGLGNWSTFKNGAYTAFYTPETPEEKVQASTGLYGAQAGSTGYQTAKAAAEAAGQAAKAQAHTEDPWVVIEKDKNGAVAGIRYQSGFNPPKATKRSEPLLLAGQPATKNDLTAIWSSHYENVYEQFGGSGKAPTSADVVNTVQSGLSPYALQAKLATQPGFVNSPAYKAAAPGLIATAKLSLGKNPNPSFIAKAIGENWDQATFTANLRKLPEYTKGPEYQGAVSGMNQVYQQIYGQPGAQVAGQVHTAALNGWTQDQFAGYLRAQPQYKTSVEYQGHVVSFLDSMGLMIGSRPVFTPDTAAQKPPAGTVGTPLPFQATLPGAPALGKAA